MVRTYDFTSDDYVHNPMAVSNYHSEKELWHSCFLLLGTCVLFQLTITEFMSVCVNNDRQRIRTRLRRNECALVCHFILLFWPVTSYHWLVWRMNVFVICVSTGIQYDRVRVYASGLTISLKFDALQTYFEALIGFKDSRLGLYLAHHQGKITLIKIIKLCILVNYSQSTRVKFIYADVVSYHITKVVYLKFTEKGVGNDRRQKVGKLKSSGRAGERAVRPSHGWISQKRCKLGLPNFHRRLHGTIVKGSR